MVTGTDGSVPDRFATGFGIAVPGATATPPTKRATSHTEREREKIISHSEKVTEKLPNKEMYLPE